MTENPLVAAADELRRALSGPVIADARTSPFATDFGRQIQRAPALVAHVRSEADIIAALEIATRYHLPCRVRGAGHSCAGQTLTDGGLVLLNATRQAETVILHDDQTVETSSRNRWTWVERSARQRGRAIPVLGDWPSLTVGGTLSVGGYGVGSLKSGSQGNQVARIRLVLPTGHAVWCSTTERAELFRHCLAGLGGLGLIERVIMRTMPRAHWFSLRTYRAVGLSAVSDMAEVLDQWRGPWPDVFYYTGKRDRFVVGVAAPTVRAAHRTPPLPAFAGFRQTSHVVVPDLPALAQLGVAVWLARFPNHLRVWSDFVLPAAALPEFLGHVEQLRRSRAFAQYLRTIYVLGIRTPADVARLPLAAVGDPAAELAFGVGLYCMVPAKRRADLSVVRAALRRCLEHCIALGGRPYLYGWHELDAHLLERAFGSSLACLRALRHEHDPHHLFNSVFDAA